MVPAGWDRSLTVAGDQVGGRAYTLLAGAIRAQVLPALGLTATALDRKEATELASLGWSDAAEWERASAALLVRYQPDNVTARQVAQKRENGLYVPPGWVCALVRNQPELVRVDQLRGILLEVSHGR